MLHFWTFLFLAILVGSEAAILRQSRSNAKICETEECRLVGERLKSSINFSSNPCENFYEYACGTWKKNNPLPGSKARYSQFNVVTDRLEERIQDILSSPLSDTDVEALQKVKRFYSACLDIETQDARGLLPLLQLINKFGGWPLIDSTWDHSNFNLQSNLAELERNFGSGFLFDVGIQADPKNATSNRISIDQPDFFLAREYFLQSDFKDKVEDYKIFLNNVATEIGNNSLDETSLNRQIVDMISFETKLANASAKMEDRGNITKTYNLFTVRDFQGHFTDGNENSVIEWNGLLNKIFMNFTTISNEEEIIIAQPDYLRKLRIILTETPLETIANYIQWRIVSSFVQDTTTKLRDISFNYVKTSQGLSQPKARKEICSNFDVSSRFFDLGEAVSSEYIKKSFPKEHKEAVSEMVDYLRGSFSELLEDATWMDDLTKKKAEQKIKKMIQFIGYPEFITNSTKLNKHYENLQTHESRHFENLVSYFHWVVSKALSEFRKPNDRNKMHGHAVFVNAFYEPESNSITFPAGILAQPLFMYKGPASINFGGAGVIMGHEITHGFDTAGSQYDEDGNAIDWWSPKIKQRFIEKAQCFVDQYSSFSSPVGHINGKMTAGENIADNGGVRQAYKAYQNWIRDKNHGEEEPRLTGLENLSHDQLFFLGYATIWCQNITPEKAQELLMVDVHSPGAFRTLGGVMNSPKFSEAFGCPQHATMNPPNKCLLW